MNIPTSRSCQASCGTVGSASATDWVLADRDAPATGHRTARTSPIRHASFMLDIGRPSAAGGYLFARSPRGTSASWACSASH